MKYFVYHFVLQKTEALIQNEKGLLGESSSIVIEIDEDELVDEQQEERRSPKKLRPGTRKSRTGHLTIE